MLSLKINKRLPQFEIDVEFNINDEVVILFGPSGSGKTTILNCISGLTEPTFGRISLDGDVLYETKKTIISVQKRNIGYLFQDYALFPHMTVEKNIHYGSNDKALVNQLVHVLGIKHLLPKYPRQISGGEKQRVALARALATKPRALLLDEPFSALDHATREECHEELLRLFHIWRIPIVMVTHDLQEANKLGNRIIKINKGKIIEIEAGNNDEKNKG